MTQSQSLDILKTGANVFLTGEPGAGKTYVLNEYAAYLRSHEIEPDLTASTGIAATHIGGFTIHSWSGIGIKKRLEKNDLLKIARNQRIAKRIRRTKVIIIEEVSMLPPDVLDLADAVCRMLRNRQEPFGGMQVIFSGDFFQLPPVHKNEIDKDLFFDAGQAEKLFAYDSLVWEKTSPIVCYLEEQYRQDDKNFLAILSAIRRNDFTEEHMSHIKARKSEPSKAPDYAPKLFSHNVDVDRINSEKLAKLPGPMKLFEMESFGQKALVDNLRKGCLSPEKLCLKTSAAVMFTKNNFKAGFANGTLGIIEEFDKSSGNPIVKLRTGKRIKVEPMEWIIEERASVRAGISQLPLRLAWAITVHKSQGMSMDEAAMDLSSVFEFGQGYVALSRVRRLSGLHIFGWNEKAFQVHPEILVKDKFLRAESNRAQEFFSKISGEKLKQKWNDFISACDGKINADF